MRRGGYSAPDKLPSPAARPVHRNNQSDFPPRFHFGRLSSCHLALRPSCLDQNVLAFYLHREASNRHAGIVKIVPSRNVVLPTMPRTGHAGTVQFAFRERATAMFAIVPDRVIFPARIEERDSFA